MNVELRAVLDLRRQIWNAAARTSTVNKGLTLMAGILENKILDVIDESTPAGRAYKISGLVGKKLRGTYHTVKHKRGDSARVDVKVRVAAGVHIASAFGQPPAKLTGTLYRNIKVRRMIGRYSILATVRAKGVDVLDDPARLSRLFFRTTIETFYEADFNDRARLIVQALLTREDAVE